MVCRLIEGWESSTAVADYAGKWTSFAGGTVSAAAGRFGNGARMTSGTQHASRTFDGQATWVVGFALRIAEVPSSTISFLGLLDAGTSQCGVAVQATTGLLLAYRSTNATVLGTASAGLTANTWHYVEAKFTIHDTAGVAVVRLNGTPVLTLSGVDTRNAGTTANQVRIGPISNPSANWDVDDVYVFDGSGSVNADFAGDCRVERVLPTGAGATTGWTPSAGSNYQCVDDADANEDTDYVSASSVVTDTYAYGDLSVATSGAVKAVQATAQARKDDAGSRSLALVARPGSTDRVGTAQGVLDSYTMLPQVWDTNPDTAAAWTVAETNASQFGVRLLS